jgi:hypothetical protein
MIGMTSASKISVVAFGLLLSGCDGSGFAMGEAAEVQTQIKQSLAVPDSARFSDVGRCPSDKDMWRGNLDAQNRMGAYTGAEPFFFKDGVLTTLSDRRFTKSMNACYGSKEENWRTSDSTNPLDDSKIVIATGEADVDLTTGTESNINITVRCQSGKTEMWIAWDEYLGDDSNDVYSEWKRVTVRVGKQKARTERWGISTDGVASFAPDPPQGLLRQMAKSDQAVFQTTPYNESPITATFKLEGFMKALEPVAQQCGWSLVS